MTQDYQFKDVRFMTAAQKRRIVRQWRLFLKSGFAPRHFKKSLYEHLTANCDHIAHFTRSGFYSVYFEDPSNTQRFLDQFDRSTGCVSAEYGVASWLNKEDYRDINNAMVDVATSLLPELRRMLRERETANARQELAQAERRLSTLLAAS